MLNVYKSQLIEAVLPGIAGGNQATVLQFPDQPYLRYKKVFGIEIVNSSDMTLSPANNTPVSAAQAATCYLQLYLSNPDNKNEVGLWIQDVPFCLLHRVQNATPNPFVRIPYLMVGQVISWEKCQVTWPVAFGNVANIAFLFNVYFRD